jgi:hypothetical protein
LHAAKTNSADEIASLGKKPVFMVCNSSTS